MISSNQLPQREGYLKKRRNKRLIKYWIIFFLIVFIIGISSYISHRPNLRISKVELSGGVLVTQNDIEPLALSYIAGSYLLLFPKNNAFLYPQKALEKYLKETFKRIDSVSVHSKGFNTLTIDITERKPVALWCKSAYSAGISAQESTTTTITSDEDKCYFIDQNSTIYANAPNFSGDAYFKYYGLVTDDLPIGKVYIASSTEFAEISDFVAKTKELSLRPLYVTAKDNDEFSLIVFGGGQIYFDVKEPLSQVGQNLEALLRTPALATSTRGNIPIDYIDLRYGNKLFYKLK